MILLALLLTTDIRVSLTADAAGVRLADAMRLTLTVEGPAPLRVDGDGLDPESVGAWKLTPDGPPSVAGGRWVRHYIADPFVPGEAVRLGFDPLRVWAGGADEPARADVAPLAVRVTTGVAEASPAAARPTTGPEDVPDPPPQAPTPRWALSTLGVFGALLGCGLAWWVWRRLPHRRADPPTDPLAGLGDLPDAAFAHRLSDVVRGRLHTDAVPARRLTTAELPAGPSRELLERLDAVRFGGDPLTPANRAGMLEASRAVGHARSP